MTYEIQEPDAPMTFKQGITIRNLGGGDVRPMNLTRQEASDKIGALLDKKDTVGPTRKYKARINVDTGETRSTMQISYDDLIVRAADAGKIAGNYIKPVPMIVTQHSNPLDDSSPAEQTWHVPEGACGFAWVNFSMKSGLGRKFGQWLIKNGLARKDDYLGGCTIWISDHGQSVDRKSAHANAMAKILQEAGIADAHGSSRLD